MGTTTRGLPYMDPDDALANVDLEIKALAEAVMSTPGDPGVTIQTGWTLNYANLRRIGTSVAFVDIGVTRTGATLTASASGNITGNTVVLLPSGWRPARLAALDGARGAQGTWLCQADPSDFLVRVEGGPPTATIAAGDTLFIQGIMVLS